MPDASLPEFVSWPTFPFEGDIRVKNLEPPATHEPPRQGEDASTCTACAAPDEDYIWVADRWRVRGLDHPTGLPMVLILECRPHLDLGDLPNLLAAELGVMVVRLERAIRSLEGVARVHVNRWGDGSAHLHLWFLARPTGRLQLRGTFLSMWDGILPPVPETQWRENLALVAAWLADFGGRAVAEPPHIAWTSFTDLADQAAAENSADDLLLAGPEVSLDSVLLDAEPDLDVAPAPNDSAGDEPAHAPGEPLEWAEESSLYETPVVAVTGATESPVSDADTRDLSVNEAPAADTGDLVEAAMAEEPVVVAKPRRATKPRAKATKAAALDPGSSAGGDADATAELPATVGEVPRAEAGEAATASRPRPAKAARSRSASGTARVEAESESVESSVEESGAAATTNHGKAPTAHAAAVAAEPAERATKPEPGERVTETEPSDGPAEHARAGADVNVEGIGVAGAEAKTDAVPAASDDVASDNDRDGNAAPPAPALDEDTPARPASH